MELIFWLLLSETAVALALFIIFLVILIWILLRKKIVTVPNLTLVLNKTQYDHGEEVDASGVDQSDTGVPAESATVNLDLMDSSGTEFKDVASAVTDTNGNYSASFDVPSGAAPGQATLTATDPKTRATATATFTFKRSKCSIPEECEICVVKRSCPYSPFYPYDERGFPKTRIK